MTSKYNTPAELLQRACWAISELESARKSQVCEFAKDLRYLNGLRAKLITDSVMNEPELFDVQTVLSPELVVLLEAPLSKYA